MMDILNWIAYAAVLSLAGVVCLAVVAAALGMLAFMIVKSGTYGFFAGRQMWQDFETKKETDNGS